MADGAEGDGPFAGVFACGKHERGVEAAGGCDGAVGDEDRGGEEREEGEDGQWKWRGVDGVEVVTTTNFYGQERKKALVSM